ncbi:hypothetical protein [Actinophytocola sediminis]
MTDRALRRWLAPLVPALLLAAACSQPVAGTPSAGAGGDDRPSRSERTSPAEEPDDEPDDEPPFPSATSGPSAGAGDGELEPLVGTWEGEYTCGQGVTGLTLTIEPADDKSVAVVFEFFPLPENPEALAGSYQMVGKYSGNRLVFRQEKWIDQPADYLMVDLEVTSEVEPGMDAMTGDVLSSTCEAFAVNRAD